MFGYATFAQAPFAALGQVPTTYASSIAETATGTDVAAAIQLFVSFLAETATGTEAISSTQTFETAVT